MARELWLPGTARDKAEPGRRVRVCLVPTSDTDVCGKEFALEHTQQYKRHIKACASRHEDVIQRIAKRRRDDPFVDGSLDPERLGWIRKREQENIPLDYSKEGVMT